MQAQSMRLGGLQAGEAVESVLMTLSAASLRPWLRVRSPLRSLVGRSFEESSIFRDGEICTPAPAPAPAARHGSPVAVARTKKKKYLLKMKSRCHLRGVLSPSSWEEVGLDAAAPVTLAQVAHGLGGRRVALVLGAEGEGLRRLTRETCDELARLPIAPEVESLNVSAAAAVALYELARR